MTNIKSTFFKNIRKLVSGNIFAQIIQLATIPILTRIYTPTELGVFALFMSFLAIVNSFITAKYDSSILLINNNISIINMSALIFIISFFISLLILILMLIFNYILVDSFSINTLDNYFYFIPLMTFLFGVYQTIYFLNLKLKQFDVLKIVTIRRSYVRSISQILFGLFHFSSLGLIIGQLISTLSGFFYSIKKVIFYKKYIKDISFKRIKILMYRYKDFPKYYLPSSVLNISSYEVFSIIISYTFSMATLGLFIIGKKAIGMPSRLVSTAIKNVFMQELTDNLHKNISSHKVFLDLLFKLSIASLFLFGAMFFVIEDLFLFVFGEKWLEAGIIAKYLLPYYGLNFIAMPLSVVLIVYEKQKIHFLWQLILMCVTIMVFLLQLYFNWELYDFLLVFSMAVSIHLIILIVILFFVSKHTHINKGVI